jgi:hypothetical protein
MGPGGDGLREFCAILDLSTGERKIEHGSWGGANMFNPNNRVDLDEKSYVIPPNFVVVKGHQGGGRGTYAYVVVRPDMVTPWLPAKSVLSKRQQYIIDVLKGYNSQGRKDEFNRWDSKFKRVPPSADEFKALEELGLLKITKSGAISLTTTGKNAASGGFCTPDYAAPGE